MENSTEDSTFELEPFQEYILEDKSKYRKADGVINKKTGLRYSDSDKDWLLGASGGFLPNMSFTFKKTERLRKQGLYYLKNKTYTIYKEGTPEHTRFRLREESRRKNGFTARCKLLNIDKAKYERLIKLEHFEEADKLLKPLRISGEHYNFINYGRIILLDEHKVISGSVGAVKEESIPIFIDSQYWYMKAKEFAKRNGFHMIVGKSRRKGVSYMEGCGSANSVNLNPKMTVIHGGYMLDYVIKGNALSPMAKNQLEFYEYNTPFHRNSKGKGLLKKDLRELRLGYKDKHGTERGILSKILAIGFKDNPDAAIGKDALEIKLEELSNFPNFDAMLEVTEPTTRTGAYTTGFIIGFGTGGSKAGHWIHFEKNYYNPRGSNFMPFENIYDSSARHSEIGCFLPYWYGLQGLYKGKRSLDNDGNTDYDIAMNISRKERANVEKEVGKSSETYIRWCGQYANRPSESFSSSGSNLFTSAELIEHVKLVKLNNPCSFRDGIFVNSDQGVKYHSLEQLEMMSKTQPEYKKLIHPYIENFPLTGDDDPHGAVRMFYPPYKDSNGNIPDDLYYIAYDTVGKDVDEKELKLYHSLASFQVLSYSGHDIIAGDQIMASFAGRFSSMEEIDKLVYRASIYYNAKVIVEVDRGNTIASFRKWGALNRLYRDPMYSIQGKLMPLNAGIGINIGGSTGKAEDGMKYIRDWLYEPMSIREDGSIIYRLNYIYDLPLLLELSYYSKGVNVDRLSSLRAGMYQRLAYRTMKKKPASVIKDGRTILSKTGLYMTPRVQTF